MNLHNTHTFPVYVASWLDSKIIINKTLFVLMPIPYGGKLWW